MRSYVILFEISKSIFSVRSTVDAGGSLEIKAMTDQINMYYSLLCTKHDWFKLNFRNFKDIGLKVFLSKFGHVASK